MKILKVFTYLFILTMFVSLTYGQTKKSKSKAKVKTEEAVPQPAYVPPPPAPDGVFIQISSGLTNPQSVLMALTMALRMSTDHEVMVFLDVKGPEIVLSKTQSLEMRKFEPSKILIQKLLDAGVKIGVCSTCLEVMNKTEFDLIKGVKIASKDDFFDFTKGRILSFSY